MFSSWLLSNSRLSRFLDLCWQLLSFQKEIVWLLMSYAFLTNFFLGQKKVNNIICLFFFKFIYLGRERVCAHESGKGREEGEHKRGGTERESPAGSALSAQIPSRGSTSQTVRSCPEPRSRVDAKQIEPPRCPIVCHQWIDYYKVVVFRSWELVVSLT